MEVTQNAVVVATIGEWGTANLRWCMDSHDWRQLQQYQIDSNYGLLIVTLTGNRDNILLSWSKRTISVTMIFYSLFPIQTISSESYGIMTRKCTECHYEFLTTFSFDHHKKNGRCSIYKREYLIINLSRRDSTSMYPKRTLFLEIARPSHDKEEQILKQMRPRLVPAEP